MLLPSSAPRARYVTRSQIPSDIVITGNVIVGWPENPNGLVLGRGIGVFGAERIRIVDNRITRTRSSGILVAGSPNPESIDPQTGQPWRSADVLIAGNTVVDAGQNTVGSAAFVRDPHPEGILVTDSDRVEIRGNAVTNSYGEPLVVRDCRGCDVQTDVAR